MPRVPHHRLPSLTPTPNLIPNTVTAQKSLSSLSLSLKQLNTNSQI